MVVVFSLKILNYQYDDVNDDFVFDNNDDENKKL